MKFEKLRQSQRQANKTYYEKNKDKIKLTRKPLQLTEEQKIIMREKARIYKKLRYNNDPEYKEMKQTKNREHQRLKKQQSKPEVIENL
jgi:hypothetical protein